MRRILTLALHVNGILVCSGVQWSTMVYRPNVDPNLAFVLMPFKSPFEDYYEDIIKPAAKAASLVTRKADEIYSTGPIIQDIWKQIWAAAVVIADVTGKNPNVNYELGICHTLGVPTVIITQSVDDVPFDYRHRRCIPYSTAGSTWQRDLKKKITATLKQVLAGEDLLPELGWPYDTSLIPAEQTSGQLIPARDARDAVVHGARIVREAVAYAFGPHGGRISANLGQDQQRYYKRGTDIASSIHSSETLESTGISESRQLAIDMRNTVGDGSKTAVLLFQQMLESGNAALKRNHPRNDVLRGMERAVEVVVSAIRSGSKQLAEDAVVQIARTASGGNSTVATIVVEAFRKAGRDGLIVVEHTDQLDTSLDVQEGMQFDRGYLDAAFVSPTEGQECTLHDAYILTYDFKISSMQDLLPLLEQIAEAKRTLLIIADDVEGEALATLVLNRQRGSLDCLAVKAPGYADRRNALLQDIAVLTGGRAITLSSGRRLSSVMLQDLGQAKKVIVTRQSTTILGGAGESRVAKHVEALREAISRSSVAFDIEKLRERLARLSGAIATIRVGGISSQEISDRVYAVESAMHSVQKAIEEGAVIGGGASLLHAKAALSQLSFKRPGEVAGVNIVADALEEPFRQLAINCGLDPADLLKRLKRSSKPGMGLNSDTGKLQDLNSAGVLDPVATTTHGIQLALSHARTLLETGAWDSTPHEPSKQQGTSIGFHVPESQANEGG
jgi:chaperonin GroEL